MSVASIQPTINEAAVGAINAALAAVGGTSSTSIAGSSLREQPQQLHHPHTQQTAPATVDEAAATTEGVPGKVSEYVSQCPEWLFCRAFPPAIAMGRHQSLATNRVPILPDS